MKSAIQRMSRVGGPLRFEPLFPAHAIERCSASVFFTQPVPDKFFETVKSRTADVAFRLGLHPVPQAPAIGGFQIDVMANRIVPLQGGGGGPSVFTTEDGATTYTVAPNMLVWQTANYVRWAPFVGRFDELATPAIQAFRDLVDVSVVKLDYVDRFFWTGEWEDIDYAGLFAPSSELLAERGARAHREWHSHVGWFDDHPDRRRLFNLNVDVAEVARPDRETPAPTVGILTMVQDQARQMELGRIPTPWLGNRSVVEVLEQQHIELKKLLASLITSATSTQIGLSELPQ